MENKIPQNLAIDKRKFKWQYLLALCLILCWSAIFCIFLEGKSSYDLAFTLWDDQYARVSMEPMGRIILPQMLWYTLFFLIAAGIVAIVVHFSWVKTFLLVVLSGTIIMLLIFTGALGYFQDSFLGGRQGVTGWVILELPWLSLLLFCTGNVGGILGIWLLFKQESPQLERGALNDKKAKIWLRIVGSNVARVIILIGIILGSLLLNGGLILLFQHINSALVIGTLAGIAAIAVIFYKRDILVMSKLQRPKLKSSRFIWFSRDPLLNSDGKIISRQRAFFVNPRNAVWRRVRNVINMILMPASLGLITAAAFMTVPDEWVFPRIFDLAPWVIAGIGIGIAVISIVPEPALFYPFTFSYFFAQYNAFLDNFALPFQADFIRDTGLLLGFWVGALVLSAFHSYRAVDKERDSLMMVTFGLAICVPWMLICFVGRFQHAGQMVQDPVTDILNLIQPYLLGFCTCFLLLSIVFWQIDLAYRYYRSRKPHTLAEAPREVVKEIQNAPALKASVPVEERASHVISGNRQKIIAYALIGIFAGCFIGIQGGYVYPQQIQPLLLRNEQFGIWTVNGVVKVERHFPIQMPSSAPITSAIEVSAARGEWEGFHVLISAQPGRSVSLTNVSWTNFTHDTSPVPLNFSILETFLVEYEVDEQPDRLVVLPSRVTRFAGEHIDLFSRLRVPRDAASGGYASNLTLKINEENYKVAIRLQVYNFTLPLDRHLRTAFGGGWNNEAWYDELEYLRITQQDMGIPFTEGQQYWWNDTFHKFDFNWTAYDAAFQAQLNRGFTGVRQSYLPKRPAGITDANWTLYEQWFLENVSKHLDDQKWSDEVNTEPEHSWVELPYYYHRDEPSVEEYANIKVVNDRYHAGTSKLRTLITEEFREEYPEIHGINIWCPVIGNFEPSAVLDRHTAGQEYWFYVCVGPTAPYPNLQLWEPGHNPRLLPLLCSRFQADGFLYWSMDTGDSSYRAGFDGNGDGQVAFNDTVSGRLLPSLRLLSFSAGVEDYEYIWLMRLAIENKISIGLPSVLIGQAGEMEVRLNKSVSDRPQFVNHDLKWVLDFRADMATLLESLWPYLQTLY